MITKLKQKVYKEADYSATHESHRLPEFGQRIA